MEFGLLTEDQKNIHVSDYYWNMLSTGAERTAFSTSDKPTQQWQAFYHISERNRTAQNSQSAFSQPSYNQGYGQPSSFSPTGGSSYAMDRSNAGPSVAQPPSPSPSEVPASAPSTQSWYDQSGNYRGPLPGLRKAAMAFGEAAPAAVIGGGYGAAHAENDNASWVKSVGATAMVVPAVDALAKNLSYHNNQEPGSPSVNVPEVVSSVGLGAAAGLLLYAEGSGNNIAGIVGGATAAVSIVGMKYSGQYAGTYPAPDSLPMTSMPTTSMPVMSPQPTPSIASSMSYGQVSQIPEHPSQTWNSSAAFTVGSGSTTRTGSDSSSHGLVGSNQSGLVHRPTAGSRSKSPSPGR
jgi:hypothetical protein